MSKVIRHAMYAQHRQESGALCGARLALKRANTFLPGRSPPGSIEHNDSGFRLLNANFADRHDLLVIDFVALRRSFGAGPHTATLTVKPGLMETLIFELIADYSAGAKFDRCSVSCDIAERASPAIRQGQSDQSLAAMREILQLSECSDGRPHRGSEGHRVPPQRLLPCV